MFWSKVLVSALLIMVSLNGCSEIIIAFADGAYAKKLQSIKEPLYLETVDNDEFKKFILEKNLIKGLKESDILWVDNAGNDACCRSPRSIKIVLTKSNIYQVFISKAEGLTNENYQNYEYEIRSLNDYFLSLKGLLYSHGIITKIVKNQEGRELDIENNTTNLPWYYKEYWFFSIKSRYNDIDKIKFIIDERDYVKKLQADSAQE